MKKKYKLIKEYYPGSFRLGDIVELKDFGSPHGDKYWHPIKGYTASMISIEDEPEHWAEYKFTTIDGVEIYSGEKYWINSSIDILYVHAISDYYNVDFIGYSTKKAAEDAENNWKETEETEEIKEHPLIKEAKERYPIGSKYHCIHTNKPSGEISSDTIFTIDYNSCIRTDNGSRCCYDENKIWAEVIKIKKDILLEENKWYRHKDSTGKGIYLTVDSDPEKPVQKGFANGKWSDSIWIGTSDEWEEANMPEVQELLLAEAKRRYPRDSSVKSMFRPNSIGKILSIEEPFDDYVQADTTIAPMTIWFEGKWAERMDIPSENESIEEEINTTKPTCSDEDILLLLS